MWGFIILVVLFVLLIAFADGGKKKKSNVVASQPSNYSFTEQNTGKEYEESNFGATKTYFNKVYTEASRINDFYDTIKRDKTILTNIDQKINMVGCEANSPEDKARFLFLSDLIKCYEHLGHDATNLFTREGLPMAIVEGHTISEVEITYDNIQLDKYKVVVESINDVNKAVKEALPENNSEDFLYLNEVFKACNSENIRILYFSLLYRFFSAIAEADDHISSEENECLEALKSFSNKRQVQNTSEKSQNDDKDQTKEEKTVESVSTKDPLEELQTLIGLSEVKDEVTALTNFVRIQKEREKKGMKAVGLSYHCVFTGNPGTGKTTVARILAEIYKSLGIIEKGHLVETDRSGLVAEYVGQTAVKTNKMIDSALDGVLFIDEAYSLVQGGGNDFGQEAISTLLKRMEDDRNRLIVILAGYSGEMKQFIDSNPGLQSRFNRYIHFADYTADELQQIFMLNVKKNQYLLDAEGQELLVKILNDAIAHKDKNFGNGRYVRNLFEKTILNQAMRLSHQSNLTTEELSTLKAEDLLIKK